MNCYNRCLLPDSVNQAANTYEAIQERLKAMFSLPEQAVDIILVSTAKSTFLGGFWYYHKLTYIEERIVYFRNIFDRPDSRLERIEHEIKIEPTRGRII